MPEVSSAQLQAVPSRGHPNTAFHCLKPRGSWLPPWEGVLGSAKASFPYLLTLRFVRDSLEVATENGGSLAFATGPPSPLSCVPVLLRDGDHYDALRDCLKAISLNPCHLKAHFRLARCLFELKYVAEALECLDDFKGKFPEQAHSSACDALGRDITAALFSKSDGGECVPREAAVRPYPERLWCFDLGALTSETPRP